MIELLFELLKCKCELLSSPFRVAVHIVKGLVILLSVHCRELPTFSGFPPNRGMAPSKKELIEWNQRKARAKRVELQYRKHWYYTEYFQ